MSSARRKFGAFGGVFTPSILTILGVIMYLRLPWIIGNAGLWYALAIILAAHVVSVTTGLSVSSIATDKRVEAGGSYFIISRSLGLPIGGTLGLALFVGLSFGVSLYLVGFSESFLSYLEWGLDPQTGTVTPDAIRVAGTAALLVVTIITFISTSLAIKTQYFIMAAIALSLLSILVGNADTPAPTTLHLEPLSEGPALIVLFGVFFPAVTGFEAGVSMSGDLRDPKGDIPGGTLAAIGVGLVVYIGLCVFLAWRIPADQLAGNPKVLLDYAFFAPVVVAGIWGATLSSALGSILGAPRILQACAIDRIGPRWFSRGSGPDSEPRNALLVTFVIAECGILIGSLDAIAAVVSMFFMASYAVLNLSCAVESWTSPDFRPAFPIPRWVSVVGSVACLVLMMQLDVVAMFGAFVALGLIYTVLKRKQLALEGGDTWSGVWSSVARKALDRLARGHEHERNWRPNLLIFARDAASPAFAVGRALTRQSGVSTECVVQPTGDGGATLRPGPSRAADSAPQETDTLPEGTFRLQIPDAAPLDTVLALARHHGLGGMQPNTVVLDASFVASCPGAGVGLARKLRESGRHLVLARLGRREPEGGRSALHLWWRGGPNNLAFQVALTRVLTATGGWTRSAVALHVFVADPAARPRVERRLTAWLQQIRVDGSVHVLDVPAPDELGAVIARRSEAAGLTVIGLTLEEADRPLAEAARTLPEVTRPTLLVVAAPTFADPVAGLQEGGAVVSAAASPQATERPVWAVPELDTAPPAAQAYHAALAGALEQHLDEGPRAGAAKVAEVITEIERLARRAFEQLERATRQPAGARRLRALRRCQHGLLSNVRRVIESAEVRIDEELAPLLTAAVAALDQRLIALEGAVDEIVALPLAPGSEGVATRWWRRLVRREPDRERWPLRAFVRRHHDREAPEVVRASLDRLLVVREALLQELGGTLTWVLETSRREARRLATTAESPDVDVDGLVAALEELTAAAAGAVDDAVASERAALAAWAETASLRLAVAFNEASPPAWPQGGDREEGAGPLDPAALIEGVARDAALQHHHLTRGALDVSLWTLHHDLEVLAEDVERDAGGRVQRHVLGRLDAAIAALRKAAGSEEPSGAEVGEGKALAAPQFDDKAVLARMTERIDRDLEALPESVVTVTLASFEGLAAGRYDAVEEVTMAVRRLVSFVVRSDVIGPLRDSLAAIESDARRAAVSVRDVSRLLSFQERKGGPEAEPADAHADEERLALLEAGVDRLEREREQVAVRWEMARASLRELTLGAIDRTGSAAIGRSAGELERFILRQSTAGFISRVGEAADDARARAQRSMVDLSYRLSSSVAAARRLQEVEGWRAPALEQLIAVRRAVSPDPAVTQALPIVYREVFLGRGADDPAFWDPPAALVTSLRQAVAAHDAGAAGAVWLTGPPGQRRSGLLRRVVEDVLGSRPVAVVVPPDRGSTRPMEFDEALLAALRSRGLVDEALAALQPGSVVRIDGLEQWWERRSGGLQVLEHLAGVIDRHGSRVLFLIGANEVTLEFLRRLGGLADRSLATLRCPPLDALALRDTIVKRHESSGLGLLVTQARRVREPSGWRLARIFAELAGHSEGDVGGALTGWIARIEAVRPGQIVLGRAVEVELSALDVLTAEQAALLAALVMHGRADVARLARVMGVAADDEVLTSALAALRRAGVVVGPDDSSLRLDRFLGPYVVRWLGSREVIS